MWEWERTGEAKELLLILCTFLPHVQTFACLDPFGLFMFVMLGSGSQHDG